jgi:hypothetical protein
VATAIAEARTIPIQGSGPELDGVRCIGGLADAAPRSPVPSPSALGTADRGVG